MNVQRFAHVEDFLEQATPYLVAREAEHNRILGICNVIAQGAAQFPGPLYFATIEEGGEVAGAAMRAAPFQLHLAHMSPDALPILAADVRDFYGSIPAAVGEVALAEAFAQEWCRLTGLRYRPSFETRVFQLTDVRETGSAPGSFRLAQPKDRDQLVDWLCAFHDEALGKSASHGDRERLASEIDMDLKGGARGMTVWEDDGAVVSMAGFSGPTPNGIRVLHVYTPPELRGRGYATTSVAALSQYLLDQGRRYVFLFTDLANPTSNHIYQMIGYEPMADVTEYAFE